MDEPEFSELFAMWRNEGLTPLSLVQAQAALLLEGAQGPLNDEQRRALEIIDRSCGEAIECWQHPSSYLALNRRTDFEATSLPEIIEEVLKILKAYTWIDDVEVVLPNSLPMVKSNWTLATAIKNFIMWDYASSERASTPVITAKLQDNKSVGVEIQPGYKSTQMLDSNLDYPGTRLYVANSIIQQHGGQVAVSIVNQNVQVQFNLLPWENDISH